MICGMPYQHEYASELSALFICQSVYLVILIFPIAVCR